MLFLVLFAFIAGVVTVLSPCILPLLPIILSTSSGSGKRRPLGVVVGFVASFTFFTLFLSAVVKSFGIAADSLRQFSIWVLLLFGLSLLIPQVQRLWEKLFSKFASLAPNGANQTGFGGGVVVGLSLGLLWTPCVGPILASVISLAITGTVTAQAFFITLAYALGTALPMFGIMLAGSTALQRVPWLVQNTAKIQKGFGVLMIATAIGIWFNVDRQFQTYILQKFPNYGVGLTKFEDNKLVADNLEKINQAAEGDEMVGKSMADIVLPKGKQVKELIAGGQWFNPPTPEATEGQALASLRGKVVLIDFWTYTCINCQRTFPYLRDWWEKYQDDGLVIIGVHAPEFEFEKDPDNVAQALEDFNLTYPVMQDNEFATWRAYNNRYWPAKYLIDKDGAIRYTHFGEGAYDETEKRIQELLAEAGSDTSGEMIDNTQYRTYGRTPELYLGYGRVQYLTSPEKIQKDRTATYSLPSRLGESEFAYEGEWLIAEENAAPLAGAKLILNFEAKQVYLVARPKNGNGKMKIRVDGETRYLGSDVVEEQVTVDTDRLYRLVDLLSSGKHELTIEFEDDNIEVFALTFG